VFYLDTSVLLVYTLTQAVETDRFPATESFFAKITAGSLLGATSFYALQEVHVFAIENAPDFPTGAAFGKAALEKILALPLLILPFVSRTDRKLHARRFTPRCETLLTFRMLLPHRSTDVRQLLRTMNISERFPTFFPTRCPKIFCRLVACAIRTGAGGRGLSCAQSTLRN